MIRVALLLLLGVPLPAQQLVEQDPRALGLAVLRARADLTLADSAYSRARQLFVGNLVSAAELETRAAERERAVLVLLERWAAFSSGAPRLRVLSARKARDRDGEAIVRVRIARDDAWLAPEGIQPLPRDLRERFGAEAAMPSYLSIKDEPGVSGTAIGAPYERRLADAPSPAVSEVEFRLLRDADAVVVSLSSGGRIDERKVWLEADLTGATTIQATPFAQEADLGAEAVYELAVERFGAGDAPLRLEVEGLPPAIAHAFADAVTGARVGQVRFAPAEHQRRLRLTLALPAGDARAIAVDSAYRFRVLAVPASRAAASAAGRATQDRPTDPSGIADWTQTGAGVADLELVARGVGRVELRALNLFHELVTAQPLDIPVVVRNTGSRSLDRVRLRADLPSGWTMRSVPDEIRHVVPGSERAVRLTIAPAAGAEHGDYEARLLIEGNAGQVRLAAAPTVLRVRLQARRSGATAAALLGGLLVLGAVIVAATRRLSRR